MRPLDNIDPADMADVGGTGETVAFTVAANSDMIRRMIKDIYSDGAKTVSRELIANALDAHAMSGKSNTQIVVHLPTMLDPTFRVRDFGGGMTHDFIMRLYTSLGHSEKTGTNDATGMFGIGSKSPLAISDTFTVRAFDPPGFNGDVPHMVRGTDMNETGRVRLYTVYFNDAGAPVLSHTFDVAPREGDEIERGGVLIEVPIATEWYGAFMNGIATQQFIWFDKDITFDGSIDVVKEKFYRSICKASDGFYFADDVNGDASWNVQIRQGAALYPLDESAIMRSSLDVSNMQFLRSLCKTGRNLMFDVPIGTIAVTPAREAMKYSSQGYDALARIITERLDGFRERLKLAIGDAYNYRTALINLADEFLPKNDRKNLAALRGLVPLAHLAKATIDVNYATHYALLPDVPKSHPKVDAAGGVMRDSDGHVLYEVRMERPVYSTPNLSERMYHSEFPEGKVLLHTASLWVNHAGPYLKVNTEPVSSFLPVSVPNVFYIIPNHLQKWADKLREHAKATFSTGELPRNEGNAIDVYIVRCAKKNVDGVRKIIQSRGVEFRVFTADDMPDIVVETVKPRTFSKTSVYAWNPRADSWHENKVEPDYSKPAIYVVRVGVTQELYTHNPLKAAGTSPGTANFTLRPRVGNYDFGRAVRYAQAFGDLPKDIPIYRVTEGQGERIAKTVPDWEHAYTKLALACEKRVRMSTDAVILQSSLASTGDHYLNAWMKDALRAQADSKTEQKYTFDTLFSLCENDTLFLYTQAARYCLNDKTILSELYPDSGTTKDLSNYCSSLFGNAYTNYRRVEIDSFNTLASEFDGEYSFFTRLVGSSSSRHDTARHLGYYLTGFMADLKTRRRRNFASIYPQIIPMVERFKKDVDAVYARVYGVKTEEQGVEDVAA